MASLLRSSSDPVLFFFYLTSFPVTWPRTSSYLLTWLTSHGRSPDRSLDLLSHDHLIVLTTHCSIVLTTYCSRFPLFPPYCSWPPLFSRPIVRLLRTLSQVAASVVYKLACIVEREALSLTWFSIQVLLLLQPSLYALLLSLYLISLWVVSKSFETPLLSFPTKDVRLR